MFDISAILHQATDILTGKAEEVVPDGLDPTQEVGGAGLDSESNNGLPVNNPDDLFAQFGMDGGLPIEPSILSVTSDVIGGRAG